MIRVIFLALAVGASVVALSASADEETYQCACCGDHFGKNADAPTFWRKALSLGRLVRDHKYEEVVARFDDLYRKKDYTLSDLGWTGEALFALGALKSGIHDPLIPYRFYQAEKPKDRVADDLKWMHAKYGKKIWDAAAITEFGQPMLCATGELRRADRKDPRLLNRYLSALIVTGHFEDVLHEVSGVPPNGLTYVNNIGELLAKTMQEYIGMARYEEGADYLATIKKTHGLSQATRDHWVARLSRGVEQESLTPERRKQLLSKIRDI